MPATANPHAMAHRSSTGRGSAASAATIETLCLSLSTGCSRTVMVIGILCIPEPTLSRRGSRHTSAECPVQPRVFWWTAASSGGFQFDRLDETPDVIGDDLAMVLECEMPGIEEIEVHGLQVSQKRVGARLRKDGIVLAPDDERGRLVLVEVVMPRRIEAE